MAPKAGSIAVPEEISDEQNPMLKIVNFEGMSDCSVEFTHQKEQFPDEMEPLV